MSRERPAPEAYDHLWTLLPVFVAFFAVFVLIAVVDDPLVVSNHVSFAEVVQLP